MIIHVLKAEASTCDKCIEFEKVHLQRESRNLAHPYAELRAQRNAPQATVRLQIGEHVMSAAPRPRLILSSSSSRLNVFASRVVSIAARLAFCTMPVIPSIAHECKAGCVKSSQASLSHVQGIRHLNEIAQYSMNGC